MTTYPRIELTQDQRKVWSNCPVCGSPHNVPCDPSAGLMFEDGVKPPQPPTATHLVRLDAAPFVVELVPVPVEKAINTVTQAPADIMEGDAAIMAARRRMHVGGLNPRRG